jgi:hypothetical protein
MYRLFQTFLAIWVEQFVPDLKKVLGFQKTDNSLIVGKYKGTNLAVNVVQTMHCLLKTYTVCYSWHPGVALLRHSCIVENILRLKVQD